MPLTSALQAHPLEAIFFLLLSSLVLAWVFGAAGVGGWVLKLFVGFSAAILFFIGGWAITAGRPLHGAILVLVAFGLIWALAAGWI